ncbi:MAG: ethanolamine utilization protein EutP [Clostridia bacterium]|jgi:ethanolamine utilization protein EutP|nr:ethanolamine utilization protein EutP [Clostridia bacterium]
MKKLILMGRSESGKTTLTQVLRGEEISYDKTQYIKFENTLIDTPGEYAQTHHLGRALALYSYEADMVGLLISATEPYSLFPPCITCMVNREVIGIVTKCEEEGANPDRAENWLRISGCRRVFRIDSVTGYGMNELITYLNK